MNEYSKQKWQQFLLGANSSLSRNILIKEGKTIEADEGEKKTIALPQFRLSGNWGKPGNEDRKIVEKFFNNIGRTASDLEGRINYVQGFINECGEECPAKTTTQIISALMFLEVFHALAYDFGQSVAGFLFESFLAVLLNGKAIPPGAGGIEDIRDKNGNPISIKFFDHGHVIDAGEKKKIGSKNVGGSLYDLIASTSKGKPMPYLLVLKEYAGGDYVQKVKFYEFTVGTIAGIKRGGSPGRDPLVSDVVEGTFMVGRDVEIESTKWTAVGDQPAPKSKSGKASGQLISGNHFEISIAKIKTYVTDPYVLDFGDKGFMKTSAQNYVDQLQTEVTDVFNNLAALSDNLLLYFAGGQGKSAALVRAQTDATNLHSSVQKIKK